MNSALFLILSISFLGNFLCLLPLICSWALPSVPLGDSEITVVEALKSAEFIYTVVFGIAISFPVVFDFIGHSILCPEDFFSYRDSISNFILLIAFLVPDLILLFYVIPEVNLVLLYILEIQRIINSACATFAYLNYFGGGIFENKSMTILSIMIVTGAIFRLYSFFSVDFTHIILEALSLTLTSLGSLLFSFYLMLYTKHLWSVYMTGRLTSDQFCCIVYIISSATAFSAVWGLVIMYHYPRWYQYNKTILVVQNVLYSWFYLVITVFQGRSAIREASIAKQSLEIKRMFVRYISHEIRTPLNTVKMGLQVLQQELQDSTLNEDMLSIVDDCQLACGNAVNILNDLLTFDKLEAGILKLELETFPVWDFLELTLRPFRLQALQKKVDLIIDAPLFTGSRDNSIFLIGNNKSMSNANSSLPTFPPICLTADRYKFSQVVSNIISNAIKFTKEGGHVVVGVHLLTEDDRRIERGEGGAAATHLRIEVIDTGAGLSEENQKQLFHEIIQFNPGALQSGGGSGLGLYISKGIMDAHGGRVSVHSSGEGCGCTFTIDIKLSQGASGVSGASGVGAREPGSLSSAAAASLPATLPLTQTQPRTQSLTQSHMSPAEDTASRKRKLLSKLPKLKARNISSVAHWSSGSLVIPTHATDIATPPVSSELLNGSILMFDDSHTHTLSLTQPAFSRRGQSSALAISPLQSYRQGPTTDPPPTVTGEGKGKVRPLCRILVVDDSKLNRDMMKRLLKNRCDEIVDAADGQEALSIVKQVMASEVTYDVILMDYVMPVMSGPDSVKLMREAGYAGLVIGLTGNALPEDLAYFKSQGADEVLVKPLDVTEYDAIIAKRIRSMDGYLYFI